MQMSPVFTPSTPAPLWARWYSARSRCGRAGAASGKMATQRPRLHRAAGYAWPLMLITAFFSHFHPRFPAAQCRGLHAYSHADSDHIRQPVHGLSRAVSRRHPTPPLLDGSASMSAPALPLASSPCCPPVTSANWSGDSGWPGLSFCSKGEHHVDQPADQHPAEALPAILRRTPTWVWGPLRLV